MLQVYKNGRLFSGGYENSVRSIELSSEDLQTFRVPAYLTDEQKQIFDLYFIDFDGMWHQLFSVSFEVETAEM